jgi:hypothetical protein
MDTDILNGEWDTTRPHEVVQCDILRHILKLINNTCDINTLEYVLDSTNFEKLRTCDTKTVNRQIINHVISGNKFDVLDWLYNRTQPNFFVTHAYILGQAIQYNNIAMLDWIYELQKHEHNSIYDTHALDIPFYAYNPNLIDILKWYHSKRDHIKINYSDKLIENICNVSYGGEFNPMSTLDWFLDNDMPFEYSHLCVDGICLNDEVERLKWWFDKCTSGILELKYIVDALTFAIKYDKIDVVKLWIEYSHTFQLKYSPSVFLNASRSMLEFLLREQNIIRITVTDDMINILSIRAQHDSIDFFYQNRDIFDFKYDPFIIDKVSRCYNYRMIEWWLEHRDELGDLQYTSKSIDNAINVDILEVWFKYYDILELKYTCDAMNNTNDRDILDWWYSKRFQLELKYNADSITGKNRQWWDAHPDLLMKN